MGGVLEIHHPLAPFVDPALLDRRCGAFGVALSLSLDDPMDGSQRVCCASSQLPFQDRVFGLVVLHHVLENGDEPELVEAVRVLRRGGELLILGLNRFGWRYRRQDASGRLPGLAPLCITRRLHAMGMVIQGSAGAGLAGQSAPPFMSRGASRLGLPFADLLMLQARHRDTPEVTPLRFRKSRTGVVQSAPMQG
ncbi:MAG: methyltransferase domain-containing protein [Lysobacterales bacterium]